MTSTTKPTSTDDTHGFDDLLTNYPGARYYYVDLHVHSPRASDYSWKRPDKTDPTAKEFVTAIRKSNRDVIAITDHSSGRFIDEAKKAARRHRTNIGRLNVLPGCEVASANNIHFLVILPESMGTSELTQILHRLGISDEDFGKAGSRTSLSCETLIDRAHDDPDIPVIVVAAHVAGHQGVVDGTKGEERLRILDLIDLVEISSDHKRTGKTLTYLRQDLQCTRPVIRSSDSHDARTIGQGCWVKLGYPGFAGLRQLRHAPPSRIMFDEPKGFDHPRLLAMHLYKGIFGNFEFRFNPDLNVFIGGRGTGKSAVLDLIRFVCGLDPEPHNDFERELLRADRYRNRIQYFLQDDGVASLSVVGTSGQRFVITRSSATLSGPGGEVFAAEPVVEQDIDGQRNRQDVAPSEILPLQFDGQGELPLLTRMADHQLRFIDGFPTLGEMTSELARIDLDFAGLIGDIVIAEEGLADALDIFAQRTDFECQIKRLDDRLQADVFKQHAAWMVLRTAFDEVLKSITGALQDVWTPPDIVDPFGEADATPTPEFTREAKALLNRIIGAMSDNHEQFVGELEQFVLDFESLRTRWDAHWNRHNSEYQEVLRSESVTALQAIVDHREELDSERRRLDTEVAPEIDRLNRELTVLRVRWDETLLEQDQVRLSIRRSRECAIERINRSLADPVRARLLRSTDKREYRTYLTNLYERSGIRGRATVVDTLINTLEPRALASAIRADREELRDIGSLTPKARETVVNHPEERDLLRLETVDVADSVLVELRRAESDE